MGIIGLVMTGRKALPRVLPLFRHPDVPIALKIATVVLALVIVSPLDPLSDIPFLGLLDDVALLALLANGFVALATRLLARIPVPVPVRSIRVVSTRDR